MVNVTLPLAIIATLAASVSASISSISNSTTPRRLGKAAFSARGLDLPGNDVGQAKASRADDCLAKCLAQPRCLVYTWTNYEGGTCFLKNAAVDPPIITVGVESAVLIDPAAFIGQPAREYRASYTDCDMPGFEIGQARGTLAQCDAKCFDTPQCKAVTWTNYMGGTCFFKSDVRACAPVKGATSIVVFNHVVTV